MCSVVKTDYGFVMKNWIGPAFKKKLTGFAAFLLNGL